MRSCRSQEHEGCHSQTTPSCTSSISPPPAAFELFRSSLLPVKRGGQEVLNKVAVAFTYGHGGRDGQKACVFLTATKLPAVFLPLSRQSSCWGTGEHPGVQGGHPCGHAWSLHPGCWPWASHRAGLVWEHLSEEPGRPQPPETQMRELACLKNPSQASCLHLDWFQ